MGAGGPASWPDCPESASANLPRPSAIGGAGAGMGCACAGAAGCIAIGAAGGSCVVAGGLASTALPVAMAGCGCGAGAATGCCTGAGAGFAIVPPCPGPRTGFVTRSGCPYCGVGRGADGGAMVGGAVGLAARRPGALSWPQARLATGRRTAVDRLRHALVVRLPIGLGADGAAQASEVLDNLPVGIPPRRRAAVDPGIHRKTSATGAAPGSAQLTGHGPGQPLASVHWHQRSASESGKSHAVIPPEDSRPSSSAFEDAT